MSKLDFQNRLDQIAKTKAVARHEFQSQPDRHKGEHTEDAVLDPIFWTIRIAIVGGFLIWLALDFEAALPQAPLAMSVYCSLECARWAWQAIWGSPARREAAREAFTVSFFFAVIRAFRSESDH